MVTIPNVIVIMVDQMKANASHLWGSHFCLTPALERLAETGTVYHRAYTPQPLCVPARIAFWTSQWPHRNGARTNQARMPDGAPNAFRAWKDAGLLTALVGKDHCFDSGTRDPLDVRCEISHYGFEGDGEPRGMAWWRRRRDVEATHAVRRRMDDRARDETGVVHLETASYAVTDFPEDDYGTGLVTGQVERFVAEHRETPFALWVSYPDPHTPYEAPRRFFEEMLDKVRLWPWRPDEFEDAPERLQVLHRMMDLSGAATPEIKSLVACYHAMVAFIDEGVGRILDALDRNGLREETIVVFCSDHGDFAGEHMMMAKGGAFFDCLTRIPLIVSYPPATPARSDRHEPVSLIDVVPTLFDLQSLGPPAGVQGQGLPGLTPDVPRERVFSEYGNGGPRFGLEDLSRQRAKRGRDAVAESLRRREWEGERMMVVEGRWKFVHDPTGDRDELYDLRRDPGEHYNLALAGGHEETCARLKKTLHAWRPDAFGKAPVSTTA